LICEKRRDKLGADGDLLDFIRESGEERCTLLPSAGLRRTH
jgi:hypothetical protein